MTQIDRLVREANPYPDTRLVVPVDVSALLEQRREEMQTQELLDPVEEPSRRGWLIGAAAAIVVVVGGLIMFQTLDETPPEPTAAELAEAFVAGYAAGDAEALASLATEEAIEEAFGSFDELVLELRSNEAIGFQMLPDECMGQGTGVVIVQCPYDFNALRSDELGLGPYGLNRFTITVREGEVVGVSGGIGDLEYSANLFSVQVWEPFGDWVLSNHPEEVEVLYTDATMTEHATTPGALALWGQRLDEYVAVVNSPTETAPAEGAVPPELMGVWRGEIPAGTLNLSLSGTRFSMELIGTPEYASGDVVVQGERITFAPWGECAARPYTWSVDGDQLTLDLVADDSCPDPNIFDGMMFTLVFRTDQ